MEQPRARRRETAYRDQTKPFSSVNPHSLGLVALVGFGGSWHLDDITRPLVSARFPAREKGGGCEER